MERLIRLPEVMDRTGLRKATIYLYIKKGTFPKTIQLTQRTVGWREKDVEEWIKNKIRVATELESSTELPDAA